MKQVYPDVPELDWLRDMVTDHQGRFEDQEELDQLGYVYKYLLWDQRFKRSAPQSDKWLIAYGFVLKYHHMVMGVRLTGQNKKTVAISEEQYKKLRRGEKLT